MRRVAAAAVSTVLLTSGALVAATAPAQAAPTRVAADAGADWLVGELSGGLLPGQFGGGDVGLSIDAAMSLAAVGGQDAAVNGVAAAVQGPKGKDYIAYEGFGYVGKAANATGKTLAFFQSLATPPTTVQGVDEPVLDRMEALTLDSGDNAGRVTDQNTQDGQLADDFANTLGQAFAARGLAAAGSPEAGAALDYLLRQQCPGGGFRLGMAAATATTALTCTDATAATNDVTAIVVQQILAADNAPAAARTAATRASTWLLGRQQPDGSWGGSGAESASNANSTGLAAQAVAPSNGAAATRAAAWLRGLQATAYEACSALNPDRGAVAYTATERDAARANGIGSDAADRDQWSRVMAQALPALGYLDESVVGTAPRLAAPASYQRAGTKVNLRASGLTQGEGYCLIGGGTKTTGTAAASTIRPSITLPKGSAKRTYSFVDDQGNISKAVVKALGAKRLTVATNRSRPTRGADLVARVRGLAPGEKVAVLYAGKVVGRGNADDDGQFVARFGAGRSLGEKQVVARSKFGDIRRGVKSVRVVR